MKPELISFKICAFVRRAKIALLEKKVGLVKEVPKIQARQKTLLSGEVDCQLLFATANSLFADGNKNARNY